MGDRTVLSVPPDMVAPVQDINARSTQDFATVADETAFAMTVRHLLPAFHEFRIA